MVIKYCKTLYFVLVLCFSYKVLSFSIQLEGFIDLGPKWNYVYKLSPIDDKSTKNENERTFSDKQQKIDNYVEEVNNILRNNDDEDLSSIENYNSNKKSKNLDSLELQHLDIDKELTSDDDKTLKGHENGHTEDSKHFNKKKILKIKKPRNKKDISNDRKKAKRKKIKQFLRETKNDYKVKDNAKISNFTLHVFRQSVNIFNSMKKLSQNKKIKKRIKALKKIYIEKFADFLKQTEEHKLKTKLAEQNVVLNTIDMSSKILIRLVNHLFDEATRSMGSEKIFQHEIKKLQNVENLHACKKLNFCRGNYEYSDFLVNVLSIILETNDAKIKQSANAFTEIVKTTDFTDIIEQQTQNELNKFMNKIENWDPFILRAMFLVVKRVIVSKNEPQTVKSLPDITLINRTVTFNEFIDILNKKMATQENREEWREIIKIVEDWRDGKSKDIQKVFEKIIRQVRNELEKLDYEVRKQVGALLKNLLVSIRPFGIKI